MDVRVQRPVRPDDVKVIDFLYLTLAQPAVVERQTDVL